MAHPQPLWTQRGPPVGGSNILVKVDDPIVIVKVGHQDGPASGKHTFGLPSALLASGSDFFKKAIEWQMREGKPLVINLPGALPIPAMTFVRFLQLGRLQCAHRYFPRTNTPSDCPANLQPGPPSSCSFRALFDIYIFADRCLAPKLVEDIIDLYANTTPTSLLRAYLARLLAERISTSNTREYSPEHEPDELIADEKCEEDELVDYPPELLVAALVVSGRMLRATKCLDCPFGDVCHGKGHGRTDFVASELRFCEWHGHVKGDDGEGAKKGCEVIF
ncbi:hypothetical protein TI39_contig428g00003 [Zymoseptoria brevis]|uniref:BTB domain-containing protein n=1 Tax=Zymoseptoria brevis TaxID=1047168 RepID=A0A0F4GPR6_9PEZI|nr:hypothetical protein TI39_contig428g00003 [Zymoseptoria brevis]